MLEQYEEGKKGRKESLTRSESEGPPPAPVPYQNYLWVREKVLEQLAQTKSFNGLAQPSEYWQEELAGFDYMLEASPLLVNKLRHHTFHITGLKHYEYRSSQIKLKEQVEQKLAELKKIDNKGLFVPEARELGGFGHEIDGQLVNIDTLKFYESLLVLDHSGVLDELKTNHSIVAEVGSGWGGFAFQFKQIVPRSTYVLIDFPEVFTFSATYLKTLFPKASLYFVGSEDGDMPENLAEYDFVFLPQHLFNEVWNHKVDLAINMVSFQEMTSDQVDNYAKIFKKTGAKGFYSHNRERSKHNFQLSSVSEILENHYKLKLVRILSGSYTDLSAKALGSGPQKSYPSSKQFIKKKVKNLVNRGLIFVDEKVNKNKVTNLNVTATRRQNLDKWELPFTDYHHFIGTPK